MLDITSALIFFVVPLVIVLALKYRASRHHALSILQRYGIPGPQPDFFAGNLYHLTKSKLLYHDVMESWIKKYGKVFGFYLGQSPYIVVSDLDMLKQILIKDFNVFSNRPPELYIRMEVLNKTILGLTDKRWKEVRTILTPTFSAAKMKLMMGTVEQKVDILVDTVKTYAEQGEIFDIYDVLKDLTLDVIASCAMALKTRCQQDENDSFRVMIREAIMKLHNRVIELSLMFPIIVDLMVGVNKYFSVTGKLLSTLCNNIETVMKERRRNPVPSRKDVLQLMLDHNASVAGKDESSKLTDTEIVANALVVLFAGFETTSTALGFIFHLLVKHPEVQDKLHEEISSAEDCSYNTIMNLQLMDQVFNESLRLYPPVPNFVTRFCSQEYKIGEYVFPKNSHIMVPVWHLHHNADLWPDPDKFDPGRFHPDKSDTIDPMSYVPFGAGPRYCIGTRFAMMEAKLAIFKLLKAFRFEMGNKTGDSLVVAYNNIVGVNPGNGVYVKAVPRK